MDCSLRFWDWGDYICIDNIYIEGMRPKYLSLSYDNRLLVITDWMCKLRIFDLKIRKQIWVYEEYQEIVKAEWFLNISSIIIFLEDNVKILDVFLH